MEILFIAEASAEKTREFYQANNRLYKTIRQAFEDYYGPFDSDTGFLRFFEEKGFGLEHLCVKTITKESAAKRAEARKKCIPDLAERIKNEKPKMLIVLMTTISNEIEEAVRVSGVNTVKMIRTTVFPGLSEKHRLLCIEAIKKLLKEAEDSGII